MNILWKCLIVITASVMQSLGLTLQRLSHLDPPLSSAEDWPNPDKHKYSVKMWRIGIGLFVCANLFGSTVQLAVLPLVLVCTLQAIGIVANTAFASLILKEPLTKYGMFGTVFVISGSIIVAGMGTSGNDPDLPLDELMNSLVSPKFLSWMIFSLLMAAVLIAFQRQPVELHESSDVHSSIPIYTRGSTPLSGWLWGTIGGIASAHSLLMAKLSVGLLVRDFRNILSVLVHFRFWLLVLAFLGFALGQMWCVNSGLKYASTSVLYPLVYCIYNIVTLANSMMLYGLASTSRGKLVWVIIGSVILIGGVLLLSTRFEEDFDIESSIIGRWWNPSPRLEDSDFRGELLQHFTSPRNSGLVQSSLPTTPRSPRLVGLSRVSSIPEESNSALFDSQSISPLLNIQSRRRALHSNKSARNNTLSHLDQPKYSQNKKKSMLSDTSNPHSIPVSQTKSVETMSKEPSSSQTNLSGSPVTVNATYTSLDAISPNIANPDKVRGRHFRVVFSKEQNQILKELGM